MLVKRPIRDGRGRVKTPGKSWQAPARSSFHGELPQRQSSGGRNGRVNKKPFLQSNLWVQPWSRAFHIVGNGDHPGNDLHLHQG